jgi:hypothetical protein
VLWVMWCVILRYRIMSDCDYMLSYFLGALPKLRKANVSFIMPVRPSVRVSVRVELLGPHWTGFHGILYLRILRQSI